MLCMYCVVYMYVCIVLCMYFWYDWAGHPSVLELHLGGNVGGNEKVLGIGICMLLCVCVRMYVCA
jgi:hypothetical protein